jgi:hypothetical protein
MAVGERAVHVAALLKVAERLAAWRLMMHRLEYHVEVCLTARRRQATFYSRT